MSQRKIRVGIIFGGKSGEHEVSLVSAQNVMSAINQEKYEVVPIGINKAGVWLTGPQVVEQLTAEAQMPSELASQAAQAAQSLTSFLSRSLMPQAPQSGEKLDVIFPILHGPLGEDGTVQGFLELADLPYVGCGVTGSATAMDKAIAKDIFRAQGLPIVPYEIIFRHIWQTDPEAVIAQLEHSLPYPMFAKPANLGSSVGVTKANDQTELRYSLSEAAQYDRKIVVEKGIAAREIEVSVLGNDAPRASVPGEVIPNRDFYSYAAKYIDNASELRIPAPVSRQQTEQIQALAIAAFQALDGAGLARVDFLMDKQTDEIYLNEVNTMPGFTAISMYPKLWQASGLPYPDLIDELIHLALDRYTDKQRNLNSFDVSQAR